MTFAMNPWLLRAAFAVLILAGGAAQAMRMAQGAAVPPPAMLWPSRLAALGLSPLGPGNPAPAAAHIVPVMSPLCPQPIGITEVTLDGGDRAVVAELLVGGRTPRYAYLGYASDHISTLRVARRWLQASVLAAVGLRRSPAPPLMMLAILPAGCPALDTLDWAAMSPWRESGAP